MSDNYGKIRIGLKLDAQKNGELTYDELCQLAPSQIQELYNSVSAYLELIKKAMN